jgi:hypothetical protein
MTEFINYLDKDEFEYLKCLLKDTNEENFKSLLSSLSIIEDEYYRLIMLNSNSDNTNFFKCKFFLIL